MTANSEKGIVMMNTILTVKRSNCNECGCQVYIHANTYYCPSCPNNGIEVIKDENDCATICCNPKCVTSHSKNAIHHQCVCQDCLVCKKDKEEDKNETKKEEKYMHTLIDPHCWICNVIPEVQDDTTAFTMTTRNLFIRGHKGFGK